MRPVPRRIAVAIVLIAGLLFAAELLIRAFEPPAPAPGQSVEERIKAQFTGRFVSYAPDPDLGALLAPKQSIEMVTPEFTYTLRTDHAGFPNLEPWPERLDVAVLGNSLITGSGVGLEGQFTTLLGQELGGRSVLNFGIHGGGTGHQLRAYRKFAAPMSPRLVISTLWLIWEIDNSLKFEDWLDDDPRPDFTNFRLTYSGREDGSGADGTPQSKRDRNSLRRIAGESRLLRTAKGWFQSLRGIREPAEEVTLDNGDVMLLSKRSAIRLMQGWKRTGQREVRDVFYTPLETLKQEVEAQGGTFLVALFPSKEELYAGKDLSELLLTVVRQARTDLAARGIATLDLYQVLEQQATPPPFHRVDMHLNAPGHRLVAEALAKWARERQIFPPAATGQAIAGNRTTSPARAMAVPATARGAAGPH